MKMTESKRLIWHRDSLLPYSSLWHTLCRVNYLNCLTSKDLPPLFASRSGVPAFSVPDLLFGRTKIDLKKLARWIGLPSKLFAWSDFSELSPALSFLVDCHRLKVCLFCLAEGYHSTLFSLELMERCPIHDCEFTETCECGMPYGMNGRYMHLGTGCKCGRRGYFTLEGIRMPAMPFKKLKPLKDVARWLDGLSCVISPQYKSEQEFDCERLARLNELANWSASIGLDYPDALRVRSTSIFSLGDVRQATSVDIHPAEQSRAKPEVAAERRSRMYRFPFWQDTPCTQVYRAMARHFRKHVVPDSEYWVAQFKELADPLAIGKLLSASADATLAYAEMLWSRHMEPYVHQRRWPYRRQEYGPTGILVGHLALSKVNTERTGKCPTHTVEWLQSHAFAHMAQTVWSICKCRALQSGIDGFADWSISEPICPDNCYWNGMLHENGEVAFVGWSRQTAIHLDTDARESKMERVARAREHLAKRGAVDPVRKVTAAMFTQVLPFYDSKVLAMYEEFERTLYRDVLA